MNHLCDTASWGCARQASLAALIVLLAVSLSSTNVAAISRYTSTSMSCSSIKTVIHNEGAVILRHKSQSTGNLLYNRYVRNDNYCRVDQTTQAVSVPALDTRNCLVYRCVQIEHHCNYLFPRC